MKFTKKTESDNTIRKVWSDDKTECYGVVGTVGDLLETEILTYCDYDPEVWCFIPVFGSNARFGKTREEAVAGISLQRTM